MEIDLDIKNYSYEDLLNLFHIDSLNESTIKSAYKTVLKTHPDKSKLDKNVFIFFSRAFKFLKQIYDTHKKQTLYQSCKWEKNGYKKDEFNDQNNDHLIEQFLKNKKNIDFSKWFNDIFEKVKLRDNEIDDGYDEWLKSDDHVANENIHSIREMNQYIENKKEHIRQLVPFDNIQSANDTANNYQIARTKVENYSSPLFSKLNYEDLKKAHVESVIPVTQNDYRKQDFANVNDLMNKRSDLNINYHHHNAFMKKQQYNEEQDNIQRQYQLMQQMENTKQSQDIWWSQLKQIKN